MAHPKRYIGGLTDSRRWDMVRIRPDDVIVVTPPKSGTTWMQTIIALLMSGDPDVETDVSIKMPWVDIRMREIEDVAARIEGMQHRRCLKSHTPLDGLPLDQHAQYICVFRHPLDAHFSFRNHIRNIPLNLYDMFYPEGDDDRTFKRFLDGAAEGFDMDAMPLAHIIQHYQAALALADQPNVSLFHYADMSRNLTGTFTRVAELLGVTYPADLMADLMQSARFEHMKSNAARYAPGGGTGFMESDSAFFQSGSSGKWHGQLNTAQMDSYDQIMESCLSADTRRWLEYGDAGKKVRPAELKNKLR
ncbi:sulfotransferase domain-containing protein [Sulfitobacter sp. F26204]|uniref:sulfotransferase domain-containing protein n=1 Tax=Sulfitobacter sp. F26204 TaxID=2996014 RepID=UPI00225DD530|nr:sulfotransferase domain-containing protein [Sulfitobacter sp. F26204]MCX7559736.1 sulfotransferase domain-containing protein [Sulfitobacter sp. F26204]